MRAVITPTKQVILWFGCLSLWLFLGWTLPVLAEEPDTPVGTLSVDLNPAQDERIRAALLRRLANKPDLRDLQVEVDAGVVTLRGRALTNEAAAEAVSLARRTEGVAEVVSRIEEEWRVQKRIRPALEDGLERLQTVVSYLPMAAVALALVVLFLLLSRMLGNWDGLYRRLSSNRFVQDQLRTAVRIVVFVIGVLIALELLDATALVGALLGTAGVVGLALGFAFRDLVENHIASVLLSVRQPFAPGDHVVIGDHEGKVIRLTSRATVLMTLDGNHLRIPNADVFKGVILNYSRNPHRRLSFGVGVGVNEDLQQAQKLGVEMLRNMEGIEDDPPPMALVEELGDSNVLIRFFGWVDQRRHNFIKVKSEAIRQVKKALDEAGIDMPEPIYRVQLSGAAAGAGELPAAADAERPRAVEGTEAADLSAGDSVDRQIARERAETRDVDLLDPDAPKE